MAVRLAFVLAWWNGPPAATAERIDASTRASLLLAIVVIALIGLMLMVAVAAAARGAREKLRRPTDPTPLRRHEWISRPKAPVEPDTPAKPPGGPSFEDSA